MAVHRILFVCAYNVCRSPYMAAIAANEVAGFSRTAEWTIRSRGTVGPERAGMCEVAASLLPEQMEEFGRSHAARRVYVSDVSSAHIILTATREERGAVAALQPDARKRIFTLREAILLGERPVTAQERRQVAMPGRSPLSLSAYSEILNRRRGTLTDLEPRRGLLPWSAPVHPFDRKDTHRAGGRKHEKMFAQIDGDVARFMRQADAFTDPQD